MLTEENRIWVEKSAAAIGATPTAFLNTLLAHLKAELGVPEGNIKAWLQRGRAMEEELREVWAQTVATRVAVEETVRVTQLYLNQIQRERVLNPDGTTKGE